MGYSLFDLASKQQELAIKIQSSTLTKGNQSFASNPVSPPWQQMPDGISF